MRESPESRGNFLPGVLVGLVTGAMLCLLVTGTDASAQLNPKRVGAGKAATMCGPFQKKGLGAVGNADVDGYFYVLYEDGTVNKQDVRFP